MIIVLAGHFLVWQTTVSRFFPTIFFISGCVMLNFFSDNNLTPEIVAKLRGVPPRPCIANMCDNLARAAGSAAAWGNIIAPAAAAVYHLPEPSICWPAP